MLPLQPVADTPPRPSRRLTVLLAVLAVLGLVLTAIVSITGPARAATANKHVVVSLTFDDGDAEQMQAAAVLQQYGFTGTFFIITGYVGAPGYVTRDNIATLAAAGNEIGGHTVTHPDMPLLSAAEQQRQVCQSRATLASWGYQTRSFAYPFADANRASENAVRNCGFNSARGLGDVQSVAGCAGCVLAETIPPRNPMWTRAPDEVSSSWKLQDLENLVTAPATAKGGWVQLTFHHFSDNTALDPTMDLGLFTQFIQWLSAYTHTAANNATVETVGQVVGGPVKPVVQAVYPAPAPAGVNAVKNPSMETQAQGAPSCFMKGGYGNNTPTLTTTSDAHTGTVAGLLTMANYTDGDAKWLTTFDLGECAPTVVPGQTYQMSTWYKSSTVTQFAVYLRDTDGVWHYWTSSPWLAAASTYTLGSWTTAAIPAGYSGISFGLNLFQNGTLETDDYALYNSVGAPAPAAVAPASTTTVTSTLTPATVQTFAATAPAKPKVAPNTSTKVTVVSSGGRTLARQLGQVPAPRTAAQTPAVPSGSVSGLAPATTLSH
ncbi:polysaccharide deacetylase family protein [Curtobacterium ammoniigenes]|uniref:polysaccharide deacetylase family protein n=1 Tax=Curtobacterium ammoniigenes TaxID=395387 RepID=UPI0008349D4C|nr:polysaccharide deacetylase family protein [Curtobacterium ammoniigenes]